LKHRQLESKKKIKRKRNDIRAKKDVMVEKKKQIINEKTVWRLSE
jgi:hypothetical protein